MILLLGPMGWERNILVSRGLFSENTKFHRVLPDVIITKSTAQLSWTNKQIFNLAQRFCIICINQSDYCEFLEPLKNWILTTDLEKTLALLGT
jgi:hypothetical protein